MAATMVRAGWDRVADAACINTTRGDTRIGARGALVEPRTKNRSSRRFGRVTPGYRPSTVGGGPPRQ